MNNQSKIFFFVFAAVFFVFVGITYYRYIVDRDYSVEAQADCDPMEEICFTAVCDPEEDECSGDPAEDTTYYKLVRRNAKNIPYCDPKDEGCLALECEVEKEEGCEVEWCDPGNSEFECSDPEVYAAEHPIDESVELEEVDGTKEEEYLEMEGVEQEVLSPVQDEIQE